ncbi:hypothetical protein PIB30_010732 [Stylosanthes scabra]|uniref:J domain-containing protein n=1 Tax=Stylosanthes scabra TaxID=79078 RepID=A0ABU6Y2P0_9FABA|nr:hypothetical protein [Stylosanthes scabra]
MEGGNRAEAERWLYTANKLLSARDLHGARSFAIRARECDPRFEATDLLLTVIDTLLAGEARINDLVDWYSILQVIRFSPNLDYIATQYRRLAAFLDPHRNPFAFSGYAFSLVHDAWSVLSNPSKKAIFDNELRLLTEPPPPLPPPPPQPAPVPVVPQGIPFLQQSQNLNNHHNNHNQSHDLNQNQNHFIHNQNQNHFFHQNHHHHHQQQQQQLEEQRQRQQEEQEQRQRQQQQEQLQQQQQQQLLSVSKNPSSIEATRLVVVEEEEERPSQDNVTQPTEPTEPTRPARATDSTETELNGAFWTACPYCYGLFEYPKVYEECTLLCQSCRRPFHAVSVRSPPELTGKDGFLSFCSWGFMPVGFSGDFKDISGSGSQWNPFSALVPCPLKGADKRSHLRGPWTYYDDDIAAAFVELSDATEDDSDDCDWRNINANKKSGKKRRRRNRKSSAAATGNGRTPVERPRRGVHNNAGNAGVENGGADAGSAAVAGVARSESGKKAALASLRRRGAGNLGKLDLNVEFSNDVEETAHGVRGRVANAGGTGNAEDNIEGIGFFEGLDEFLSSLPILNGVPDDKVKGH